MICEPHGLTSMQGNTLAANIVYINAQPVEDITMKTCCVITSKRRQVASQPSHLLPLVLICPYGQRSSRGKERGVGQMKRNGNTCIKSFFLRKVMFRRLVSHHDRYRSQFHSLLQTTRISRYQTLWRKALAKPLPQRSTSGKSCTKLYIQI